MPLIANLGETMSPTEVDEIAKLFLSDGGGKWNKPLATEELLEMGRAAFEPLFHQPPLGPIPEHLRLHMSVYGCVIEYEEKVEERERWKVLRLELWLQDKVGKTFSAGEKVYELSKERGEPGAPDRYWLKVILDRGSENQGGKSGTS